MGTPRWSSSQLGRAGRGDHQVGLGHQLGQPVGRRDHRDSARPPANGAGLITVPRNGRPGRAQRRRPRPGRRRRCRCRRRSTAPVARRRRATRVPSGSAARCRAAARTRPGQPRPASRGEGRGARRRGSGRGRGRPPGPSGSPSMIASTAEPPPAERRPRVAGQRVRVEHHRVEAQLAQPARPAAEARRAPAPAAARAARNCAAAHARARHLAEEHHLDPARAQLLGQRDARAPGGRRRSHPRVAPEPDPQHGAVTPPASAFCATCALSRHTSGRARSQPTRVRIGDAPVAQLRHHARDELPVVLGVERDPQVGGRRRVGEAEQPRVAGVRVDVGGHVGAVVGGRPPGRHARRAARPTISTSSPRGSVPARLVLR